MSATGTPTTNLNLRIMNGTDPVDVADINANSQTLDSRIGAIPSGMNLQGEINAANTNIETLRGGLAIIVDGDTCSVAVPAGGYAYIKNNTHGLAEGLYKNTSGGAFPVSGGSATSSVFTAVPAGLGGEVASLNSGLAPVNIISSVTLNNTDFTMDTNYNAVVRCGNIVNITAWASKKADGSFNGNLMTGLPKPVAIQRFNTPSPSSYRATKPFTFTEIGITGNYGHLNFNTEGAVMTTGSLAIVQLTYVCQDG